MSNDSVPWTVFLGPGVIAISAIIAWFGIRNVKAIAQKRATLDFIEKAESTDHYRKLNDKFSTLRRAEGFMHLTEPMSGPNDERQQIVDYLNHYELVSLGIQRGALDGSIYKLWMGGAFVRDWNAAREWIQRERWMWDASQNKWLYRSSIFKEFQKMARKWSRDALDLTKSSFPPPDKPKDGNEVLPETEGGGNNLSATESEVVPDSGEPSN
ncbi:MAG: DUF4760 domain-containing protein [Asticcacaulis sp.]